MKEQLCGPGGRLHLAAMPFAHRGHGPGGLEDRDIHQASTQTNRTCIVAQNPELLSVFISGGTDALIR